MVEQPGNETEGQQERDEPREVRGTGRGPSKQRVGHQSGKPPRAIIPNQGFDAMSRESPHVDDRLACACEWDKNQMQQRL